MVLRPAGYFALRPERSSQEPLIWEVFVASILTKDDTYRNRRARCSAAAPGYFPPRRIPGCGTFQDGGVGANNPLQLALWELEAIYPATPTPSIAISVGTGYTTPSPWTEGIPLRNIILDGFVPRLFRAMMSSTALHGQNSWAATLNGVDQTHRFRFFRLNLPFDRLEPALDDIASLGDLQHVTQDFIRTVDTLTAPCRALWASTFFFELSTYPVFSHGVYTCVGKVFCRHKYPNLLVRDICSTYDQASLRHKDGSILARLQHFTFCKNCGFGSINAAFTARSTEESFSILLSYDNQTQYPISGLPNTLAWFLSRQYLSESPFHGVVPTAADWVCRCRSKGPP